jgi:hypothetical protein
MWAIYTQFVGDDAFITFHYARQLAEGNGFVYNPGDYVYGTTTPLFTILMALWYALAPGNMSLGAWLGDLAASLVSLVLLSVMLQRAKMSWQMQLAALGFLSIFVKAYHMDMSAAETPLVIMLMMASWVALDSRRPALAGFLAGCLLWTRVDTILWLLALFLFSTPKRAWLLVLTAGLTYLPWVIFATIRFGSPIPFTIIAKNIAYATDITELPEHLLISLAYLSPLGFSSTLVAFLLGCITLGIALWQASYLAKNKVWLVLPIFILLELVRLILTGATMFSRYFAPLSWMVWILFATALPLLWQQSKLAHKLPVWVPRFLVFISITAQCCWKLICRVV